MCLSHDRAIQWLDCSVGERGDYSFLLLGTWENQIPKSTCLWVGLALANDWEVEMTMSHIAGYIFASARPPALTCLVKMTLEVYTNV